MKKGKFEKKISRRILSGLLALLMVVSGICTTWKINEAQASGTTAAYAKHYDTISAYRGSNPTAPKPTDEAYKNWIFAGWYAEETLDNALTSAEANAASEGAWAKFVPAEILSVKGQMNNDPSTADSVKLRLVTTIDNDQYSNVGFNISIPALNYAADYPMDKAYEKIVASEDSVKFEYEPSVFHEMSQAFATAIITNISKTNFDMGICVTPYWTTLDGTRVDGVGRYLRANDVLGKTVNVPVRLYSDTAVTDGSLTVNYDATTFTYLGIDNGNAFTEVSVDTTTTAGKAVCTVADQTATADGMLANLRFELKDGVTLLNRDAFDEFTITADDTWNASYVVYTSMEALTDVIPETLLSNTTYKIMGRIGLDSTDGITVGNYLTSGVDNQVSDSGAVFGSALNVTTTNPNNNPQVRVDIAEESQFSLKDVSGVLWHVDFSTATLDETKTFFRTSLPLIVDGKQCRARTSYANGKNIGYFYDETNGKWTQIADGSAGCQLPLPEGSKGGWLYVPLSAYGNGSSGEIIYDETTGLGKDLPLTGLFWIAQNFSSSITNTITLDEVLFVRGTVLNDVIPETLPEKYDYQVLDRISLDEDTATVTGSKYSGDYDNSAGVCGGALKFASGVDTGAAALQGGECTVTPKDTISLEGASGVMWYVDFSNVDDGEKVCGFCTSVPLRITPEGGSAATYQTNGDNVVAYYYDGIQWTQTTKAPSAGSRLSVAPNFKGWVYVPFTSYETGSGVFYDAQTGLGLAGATLNYANIYGNGYVFDVEKYVVYDEIMFVRTLNDVIPTSVPETVDSVIENVGYEIKNRISMDSVDEFSISLGTASSTQVGRTGAVLKMV